MNYELTIFQGAIGGPILADLKATTPFMGVAVGQLIHQPNGPAMTITQIVHQILPAPGPLTIHRILVAT